MNSLKKISKNFIYSIFSLGITIIIGLIIPRLIIVGYGSETNGLLSSVSQFIIYLGLFEAGIQNVARQALYAPVCRSDRQSINSILSAVNKNYKKTGIIYLIFLLLLSFLYPFFIKSSSLGYWTIFSVVFFSGFGNVLLFFYQGKYKILLEVEGKNYILTNIQTIISILNNIIKVILLYLGMNVGIVIFASFFVSLIQLFYIILLMKKEYKWIDLNVNPNYDALKQRQAMLVHQIAGMVFQNTDVLILTAFCGLKVVSVYSMYKMIISYISSVLNAVYNSFDFKLGQIFNTDKKRFILIIDIIESYYSALVFSLYYTTYCLILPFINLYTSGVKDINYVDSKLAILFITVELLTFIRIPMLKVIQYAGEFNNTMMQTIFETILNLVISIWGVKKFGIYGVLLGTIVALLYRTLEVIWYSNTKILRRSPLKTYVIYICDLLLFWVCVRIYKFSLMRIINYIDFIKYGFLLMLMSVCLFGILQTIINKSNFYYIKNRGGR